MRLLRRYGKPLVILIPVFFLLLRFLPGFLERLSSPEPEPPRHGHPVRTAP